MASLYVYILENMRILLREVSESEVVDMFKNGTVNVPEILVEKLLSFCNANPNSAAADL